MKKVFLGGTCNNSNWRYDIIKLIKKAGLNYFNPVLEEGEWDDIAQERELLERQNCDFCLYTITPEMTGVYSIAEAVDDSNKRPKLVILCALQEYANKSFTDDEWKSIEAVGEMIKSNGGYFCTSLEAAVLYMYQSENITIESINPKAYRRHILYRSVL